MHRDTTQPERIDAVTLARMASLENALKMRLYPSTGAITTLLLYVEAWLALANGDSDAVWATLDANGGIAPSAMVRRSVCVHARRVCAAHARLFSNLQCDAIKASLTKRATYANTLVSTLAALDSLGDVRQMIAISTSSSR